MVASRPDAGATELMENLIGEWDSAGWEITLILDNFQCLDQADVLASVHLILRSPPRGLRLMVLSRMDPPLPFSRLRLSGLMEELREDDLRFSPEESRELFHRFDGMPELDADQVAQITRRTDGWIAGICLAGLSLKSSRDAAKWLRDFSGSDRYVAEYLAEEALAEIPADQRHCLPALSVPDVLDADICAVLGEECLQAFHALLSANLFLFPDGRGFRLHPLLRQMLSHRFGGSGHPDLHSIHSRLSLYFRQTDKLEQAVQHALAAGETDTAAGILETYAGRLWNSQLPISISPWLRRLRETGFAGYPQLSLYASRMDLFRGDIRAARGRVSETISSLSGEPDSPEIRRLRGRIALQQATISMYLGDVEDMTDRCREAEGFLGDDDALWLSLASSTLGVARLWTGTGDLEASILAFNDSIRHARSAENPNLEAASRFQSAIVRTWQGHSAESLSLLEQLESEFNDRRLVQPGLEANVEAEIAWLSSETGDLTRSLLYEKRAAATSRDGVPSIPLWWTTWRMALLADRRNDRQLARDRLLSLDRIAGSITLLPWFGELHEGLRELIEGNGPDDDGIPDVLPHSREIRLVLRAQGLLRRNEAAGAMELADRLLPGAEAAGHRYRVLYLHIIRVAALYRLDRGKDAAAALDESIRLAEPGNLAGVFRIIGADLDPLMEQLPSDRIRSSDSFIRRIRSHRPTASGEKPLLFDISDREKEILALMDQGLSNQEMADRLFVSLNTVKTHLKNINRKLDTDNRSRAVAAARRLGLIHPPNHPFE